ncbi:PD-(D/E)XK nuclease-like domain-containing protein [Ponticaulis profundi]|uniref:PD-(D/E)XK nuclease-like domain-containing protein n=1 Tax=Ponticaulis profundi TaxID=2665222 RepID=A0ABW1S8A3_9PROT
MADGMQKAVISEPGVYLNLPDSDYFAVDAIGSSDIKKLLKNPADWWYESAHNPHYERSSDSAARTLGSALHCLLLEGEQAYAERFAVEPDPKDYPNAARTVKDLRELLNLFDIEFKATSNKPDLVEKFRAYNLHHRSWDLIVEEHRELVEGGMTPLTARQDRCVRHMSELALAHEDIGPAIRGGLNEVSVFWRREGDDTLYRARFDCLQPGFNLDLKSMSNWQGRNVAQSVIKQITELEYDLQRVFYDEARSALREHVQAGRIITGAGTTDENLTSLKQIASRDEWKWVWLFYQVRDDRTGKAPILVPRLHEPTGTVYEEAQNAIELALENYRDFRDRFSLDTPWHHSEPLEELEDHHLANLQYKRSIST